MGRAQNHIILSRNSLITTGQSGLMMIFDFQILKVKKKWFLPSSQSKREMTSKKASRRLLKSLQIIAYKENQIGNRKRAISEAFQEVRFNFFSLKRLHQIKYLIKTSNGTWSQLNSSPIWCCIKRRILFLASNVANRSMKLLCNKLQNKWQDKFLRRMLSEK